MDRAVDTIRERFGEESVMRARFVNNRVMHIGGGLDKERRTGITTGIHLDKELEKDTPLNENYDIIQKRHKTFPNYG